MLRLEFEQSILEMIFEVGYRQLTPATVAYYLCVPIKAAEQWLDELVRDGVLELDSDADGRLFYVLPSSSTPPPEVLELTIQRRAARGLGQPLTWAEVQPREPVAASVRRPLRPLPLDADGWVDAHGVEPRRPSPGAERAAARWPRPPAATEPPAPSGAEFVLEDPASPSLDDRETALEAYPLQPWSPGDSVEPSNLVTTLHEAELVDGDELDDDLRRGGVPPTPFVPMVLSLFWPGLGQIHNGQPGKGLLLFFATTFLWLLVLGWVVHLYAVIDAGVVATQRRDAYLRRALDVS